MKNIVLTAALLCFFATFSFSQFQIDVSSGMTHRLTELSGPIGNNGYYVYASPSIAIKNNLRFRTTIQFKQIVSDYFKDNGSLDLSPEIEYTLFNFLTLGAGVYYSHNLNSVDIPSRNKLVDLGPVGSLKFRCKNTYATIRYSKAVVSQIESFFTGENSFHETSRLNGLFQFGLGYTFGKK